MGNWTSAGSWTSAVRWASVGKAAPALSAIDCALELYFEECTFGKRTALWPYHALWFIIVLV